MTTGTALAVTLAVTAAVGYGFASVLQAVAMRGVAATMTGMRSPMYLLGIGLDVAAWATSLVALRSLPVFQVQAILASSLVVTAVTARIVLKTPLRRRDLVAIVVAVGCLAAVCASASAQQVTGLGPVTRWALAGAAVPVALLGLWAARTARPAASAVAAGLAFGGTALCSRAAAIPTAPLEDLGATAVALGADPLVWAAVGYAASGFVCYAQALQQGAVGPASAVLSITEVIVPAVIGVALLGDHVRSGWAVPAVLAVLGMLGAALTLAGSVATLDVEPDRS